MVRSIRAKNNGTAAVKLLSGLAGEPAEYGESKHDRFKRFAKALLAVPKSEVTPIERTLAKLESEKLKIDTTIVEVRRELAKKESKSQKAPGRFNSM